MPFPQRALTVPDAQSTLTFASTPLDIVASTLPIHADEPSAPAPIETQAVELTPAIERPAFLEERPADLSETQALESVELPSAEPVLIVEAASPALPPPEPTEEIPEPEPVHVHEEPAAHPHHEAPPVGHTHVAEFAAAEPALEPPVAPPHMEEPVPAPISAEPAPAEPEPLQEEAPPPPTEPRRPTPFLVPRPAPPRRPAPPARADSVAPRRPVTHPSPDSLPITPPPASAGMPTFQAVVEASGAPPISPFELPVEKHPDADRELQEYVASFRYTPPDETADELTMRSEHPVIDDEAPAEFHHPSFDDDVPPPPEAGPHPTGEEYYPPAGAARRSRFLDISDPHRAPSDPHAPTHSGTSFLGLDDSPPSNMPLDPVAPPTPRRWWLWTSLVALLLIFGGLGFLEGRAQSTHAFRGPLEIVRDEYANLRQKFARVNAPSPAAPPESRSAQPEKQPEPQGKPATSQTAASIASGTQPTQTPAQPPSDKPAAEPTKPPAQEPANPSVAPATNSNATKETVKAAHPNGIAAPTPKPSSKSQPGQQELNKAMNASDPTAAAAWLWKATSRGNPEAPVRLADMYIKGKGVPRSCEQAMVLLRSAAIKENAPARNRLAALYANGTCVVRNRVKAYQYMSSALVADPTSEWAQQNRQELWNQMSPAERAEAQKYR